MNDRSDTPADERLRPPPVDRFAGPAHAFDLDEIARELRSEEHPARNGHRQMTIFQRDHITHVVFAFDAGGRMPEHAAPGLVTIHAHDGRLTIAADGRDHDLAAGQVLVLAPNVKHDVQAHEASVMMLTVHVPSNR